MNKKVAVITGGSSGIGKKTAFMLNKKGFTVYACARRLDKMKALEAMGVNILYIDVTNDDSVKNCVNTILKKEKHIDILINNAGYGSYGAIEDVPIEEAKHQLDVNVLGIARMIKAVLPTMRKQKSGKIINISSMAGKVTTPFGGWYHGTKFAVEGLSDCLRMETAPFGIDTIIIEPGAIKTDWGIIAADNLRKTSSNGAYSEKANCVANNFTALYTSDKISKDDLIAKTILKAISAKKPKTRYLVGYGAKLSVFCRRILNDRMYDKAIMQILGRKTN